MQVRVKPQVDLCTELLTSINALYINYIPVKDRTVNTGVTFHKDMMQYKKFVIMLTVSNQIDGVSRAKQSLIDLI